MYKVLFVVSQSKGAVGWGYLGSRTQGQAPSTLASESSPVCVDAVASAVGGGRVHPWVTVAIGPTVQGAPPCQVLSMAIRAGMQSWTHCWQLQLCIHVKLGCGRPGTRQGGAGWQWTQGQGWAWGSLHLAVS